jgi:uncharacterized protein
MQLHQERPDYEFVLRGAGGDSARVNDLVLRRSFIVAPDRLVEAWPVDDVAGLSLADLEPALAMQPEVLVLGTGKTQGFPPPETLAACLGRGVGVEAMTNAAAARTYAVLAAEGRRVVAAFILQA